MSGSRKAPGGTPDWYAAGMQHIWLPYAQMKTMTPPVAVSHTAGIRITLTDGRELIDGIASWWTACHGYNHPHIRAAVETQLARMPHVMMGGMVHEQSMTLATRLAAMLPAPLERVFFSDSGSVAVEVALKMAAQYWRNKGEEGRTRFIAFEHGYHGDTFGAMSVSDMDEGMHVAFSDTVPEQFILPLPTGRAQEAALSAFMQLHADELAAVIIEPMVQGAGGMKFHDAAVLQLLRQLCDKYGLLLIFDEIFTGFGRTGTMFACEQANVVPDILTLSKALTGGTLPLAATVATKNVFDAFWSDEPGHALMHGPTFMGNALACAAANASLDLFAREPRLDQIKRIERQLQAELEPCRDIKGVKDVRVKGALGVVELRAIDDLAALRGRFIEEGVFIRPFGNVIYLAPAFTISESELTSLTSAIVKVVRSL